MDWDALRRKITQDGMRNSNCVAIAPTATSSNIVGVDASIEPCFGNLSVKSNLSGEFTIINAYLVCDLKRLGLWDDVMVMDLKHFDGSLRPIHGFHRLPDNTLTPLHVVLAMIVTRDGTIYATTLYPFTLLRIDPADVARNAGK